MSSIDAYPIATISVNTETLAIAHVNNAFKRDVMDIAHILSLNFKEIIRDVHVHAVIHALKNGDECSCDLLRLSSSNDFPEYWHVTLFSSQTATFYTICILSYHVAVTTDAVIDEHKETMIDYIDNAPIGLQWLSSQGNVLWANKTQLALLGYTAEELIGKHITEFSTDSAETLAFNFGLLNSGKTLNNISSAWKTKSGELRSVTIDSNVRFDANGQVLNTRCFIRDDTALQVQRARCAIEADSALKSLKSKDKFLRRVLHEIRTPANVIIQSLDVSKREDAQHMKQLQKLVRIIKDVEDVDSIENGRVLLQSEDRVHVMDLVHDICDSINEEYDVTGVTRKVHCTSKWMPLEVVCDRHCLTRVISHLYENALRFTQAGIVEFQMHFDGRSTHFEIRNTGAALDVQAMMRVCHMYWEDSGPDNMFTSAGIGLGLNICFNVLEHMGSVLRITSENGVNTFTFDLAFHLLSTTRTDAYIRKSMIACEPGRKAIKRQSWTKNSLWIDLEDSELSREHVIGSDVEDVQPICGHNSCDLFTQVPKRPHVLIADDNMLCQKVLKRTLSKLDCTSDVAGNGQTACDMVKTQHYDLIILDCRMPTMSGPEAAAYMTQHLKVTTPIIGFSADDTEEIQKLCKDAGMTTFLPKPATQAQLRDIVATYVRL
eukprot:5265-Heterococcus_DN1.PRE.4